MGKNQLSLILFRKGYHSPDIQLKILIKYLPIFENELIEGCIIVFEKERIRIRNLPIIQ
jgi:hypothetical protein